jgi:hypothetical protein
MDKVRGQNGLHKCNRDADADAIVSYARPGTPFITMVDNKSCYGQTDPNGAFQDIGNEVEERREDVAGTKNDFGKNQYDRHPG